MVVRTAIVVHMVLTPTPRISCLWDYLWFRTLTLLLPSTTTTTKKGLNGKKQSLWCNNLDYSCLPSWLSLMIGEISSEDQLGSRRGGWISLVGLGGKQSMLCVSILKTTHLATIASAASTSILSCFCREVAAFCNKCIESNTSRHWVYSLDNTPIK